VDGFFLSHFNDPLPVAVLLSTKTGAPDITSGVSSGLRAYPNIQVQTRAQFRKVTNRRRSTSCWASSTALLALAVVIALIGIVNTLMLSVFERTHEIGLLRAVGMKRRQVKAMIRSEAVILSLFGAIIGIVVGTALGTAFAASLKQQGINRHRDSLRETGGVPGHCGPAGPRGGLLAGAPCRTARRPGGDRSRLITGRRRPRGGPGHVRWCPGLQAEPQLGKATVFERCDRDARVRQGSPP